MIAVKRSTVVLIVTIFTLAAGVGIWTWNSSQANQRPVVTDLEPDDTSIAFNEASPVPEPRMTAISDSYQYLTEDVMVGDEPILSTTEQDSSVLSDKSDAPSQETTKQPGNQKPDRNSSSNQERGVIGGLVCSLFRC